MNKIIAIIPVSSFNTSKTRLSPFLDEDERSTLLKYMLEDIVEVLRSYVYDVIITSKDVDVLKYAHSLDLLTFKEEEYDSNYLNNALKNTIEYVHKYYEGYHILILPADIPLLSHENMEFVISHNNTYIIAPSRGGGTNLLYIKDDYSFIPNFGEFSFFKHKNSSDFLVYDSFLLSLDINTPEDLGELMLHGKNTKTYEYLKSLNINVENSHGKERLNVYRK